MLANWLQEPASADLLHRLDAIVDFDLVAAGTTWEPAQLRDTRIAQPLLFAASITSAKAAISIGIEPQVVAGHSVGEWSAAVIAGALTPEVGARLISERANAMAQACTETSTGMAAILGGDPIEVADRCAELSLSVANNNGAGQCVVGGLTEDVEKLVAYPPNRARTRVLGVAGAFHTAYMEPAVTIVRAAAATVAVDELNVPVISNLDGDVVQDGRELLDRMVRQIAEPVRWDLCMQTMSRSNVTDAVETCPAGTLSGIARRGTPEITCHRVDEPPAVDSNSLTALLKGVSV